MIEKKPINCSTIGRVLGVCGKKVYRWYKEVLSGYTKESEQAMLHVHDIPDPKKNNRKTGEIGVIAVPILKPENFGQHMTIDDKMMGGEDYTIMTNKDSGKIALMLQTRKAAEICEVLQEVDVQIRYAVKTISKDLAENYDWVARTMFPNTVRVDDKFHVVSLGLEALQDIRVRYRQEVLREERDKQEANKALKKAQREEAREQGIPFVDKAESTKTPAPTYANGDTKKELLAKGRYLLFQFEEQWTPTQKTRGEILFQEFPEIERAYRILCQFRLFYRIKIGDTEKAKTALSAWYATVDSSGTEELSLFASTVRHHEPTILNYFSTGQTNAYAESLHNQLQRFIQTNSGTRDKDYFHFRVKMYFS